MESGRGGGGEDRNIEESQDLFRYQKSVRCIAITDTCIAFFMLVFIGLKIFTTTSFHAQDLYPRGSDHSTQKIDRDDVPSLFIIICICIFAVYSLQLVMGQLLLSATYNLNRTLVLSRCQKWYWSSQLLNIFLGIELFILVFSVRGGTPSALAITLIKILFRGVANHMVKVFMWDLRIRTPPITPPLSLMEPVSSNITRGVRGQNTQIPNYEPPPSYEEALREKNFPQDFSNAV